jgi:hypothetical protein
MLNDPSQTINFDDKLSRSAYNLVIEYVSF